MKKVFAVVALSLLVGSSALAYTREPREEREPREPRMEREMREVRAEREVR